MKEIPIGKGCPVLPLTVEGNMTPCKEWQCTLWRPLQVTIPHPQIKGQTFQEEQWDCVHVLTFIGTLDTARKVNQTSAAIDSLRNVVARKQVKTSLQLDNTSIKQIG